MGTNSLNQRMKNEETIAVLLDITYMPKKVKLVVWMIENPLFLFHTHILYIFI